MFGRTEGLWQILPEGFLVKAIHFTARVCFSFSVLLFYFIHLFIFVLRGYSGKGQESWAVMSSSGLSEHFNFLRGKLGAFELSRALEIGTATCPSQYFYTDRSRTSRSRHIG